MINEAIKGGRTDRLDREILCLLAGDARLSNRNIAAKLNCTEGTIRARIKRLEQDNLMRITAVTNIHHMENPLMAYIGVHVKYGTVREVAHQLAALEIIRGVIILLGRFDILAIAFFESPAHLQNFVSDELLVLDNIRKIETSLAVDFIKYNNQLAKIFANHKKDD